MTEPDRAVWALAFWAALRLGELRLAVGDVDKLTAPRRGRDRRVFGYTGLRKRSPRPPRALDADANID
jgi:hypothetical protein